LTRGTRQGINDYTHWFANDENMKGDYFGVVADDHHRLRALRQVRPGEVRIAVLRRLDARRGVGRAERVVRRDRATVGKAVAPEFHGEIISSAAFHRFMARRRER
jgi:hypothetical protein